MRITCDACQAKYSIADDKVSGKVFKIRCKKCSHVIVVRGSAPAVVEEPPPPPPADGDWYLVIDQDQVGPMTVADVEQRLAARTIDGDTFAWREGLADWQPLAQIGELAAIVPGASAPPEPEPLAARADDVLTQPAKRQDIFADAGGELAAAATTKLRGERNESSVLFSLGNLAQIANHKPAPAAASTTTGPTGGEGSGLIDIRSMASAYLGTGTAASTRPASSIGSIDDLPVFGGGGFSEPAVLVPTARPAASSRLLYLMIGSMCLLAIVATVLVIVLMKGGSRDDVAKAPQVAQAPVPEAAPALPEPKPATQRAPTPVPAPALAPAPAPAPAPHAPVAHAPAPPAHHTPATNTANNAHPAPPPAPTPQHATDECDQVSCVVNGYEGACCQKFKNRTGSPSPSPSPSPAPSADLPESLDVGKIQAGVGTIKARAMQCSGPRGKVKVHFKVDATGKVQNVSIESSPDTALGACVTSAASRATFARTQRGGSFSYVFTF